MGIERNNPQFSIVLPCYRMEKYIERAIKDIINQTYTDVEILVINDGSDDNTLAIASRIAESDERIKIISHDKNQGLSRARNTGLKNSIGEYILFLDPDDRYEQDLLQCLYERIQESSPDVIVYSIFEEYDKYTVVHKGQENFYSDSALIAKELTRLEKETLLGYAWNKAYKRALLIENDLSFETINHIEDILFNISVFYHAKTLFVIEKPLYHYMNGGVSGLTAKYLPDYFELQKKRIEAFLKQQKDWDTCDDFVLNVAAGVYFRSIISYMERQLHHGIGKSEILEYTRKQIKLPLFDELKNHIDGGKMAVILYKPLAKGHIRYTFFIVRLISLVRRSFPGLFSILKQNR